MGLFPGAALMDLFRDETLRKVNNFNAQNIANTLWAFATLGVTSTLTFKIILNGTGSGICRRWR